MGNRVVVYADVSGTGTSTADLIVVPHIRSAAFADACFRVAAATSVAATCSISGTTINVFQVAGTTGVSYTIKVDGV